MLRLILLVVHVAAAALLFGAPLGIGRNIKSALASTDEALKLAVTDAARRSKLAMIGSVTTLLTGLALIFNRGGFAAVPKNFHAALTLLLIAMVFSATFMRPNTGRLVAAVSASPADRDAVTAIVKRLAMGSGILHLAWFVVLVLMFYQF